MDDKFTFFTDSISIKTRTDEEGEKQHYVEGYISTESIDLGNDIVTKEAMIDMARQIKNSSMKLDLEHEGPKKSLNIVPVGRIIEAKVDDRGLWIKAIINKHSSKFREVWGSIKSKMLDGFSIAYQAIKAVSKVVEGKTVRVLSEVKLINVALTGIPMNEDCRIGAVMTKSLEYLKQEETKMVDENIEPAPEAKAEEVVEEKPAAPEAEAEEAPVEEKSTEVVDAPTVDLASEIKSLQEKLEATTTEVKEQSVKYAELKEKLEAAEKALAKPQLKSVVQDDVPAPVVDADLPKSPLEMIS